MKEEQITNKVARGIFN